MKWLKVSDSSFTLFKTVRIMVYPMLVSAAAAAAAAAICLFFGVFFQSAFQVDRSEFHFAKLSPKSQAREWPSWLHKEGLQMFWNNKIKTDLETRNDKLKFFCERCWRFGWVTKSYKNLIFFVFKAKRKRISSQICPQCLLEANETKARLRRDRLDP